jgi:hypothetical protein
MGLCMSEAQQVRVFKPEGVYRVGNMERVGSVWTPQPGPQIIAAMCPFDLIFFGGSRGGGKTDTAIGRQLIGAETHGHDWNGLFLRKNFKHFNELRRRIDQLIRMGLQAERVGGDHQTNTVKFKNGARVLLTAIERVEQVDFFQGQAFTEISIEEAVQFPFINVMIDSLKACLRSAAGVKCTMFLTGNPGGPGHGQIKARFIAPFPGGGVPLDDGGEVSVFIPSKVEDNRILCDNDPKYVNRLRSIKDRALRKAWLEGDWDVVLGGFFDDVWDVRKNVLPRFRPPMHWPRLCGLDWGSAKPFSVGWYAVSDGEEVPELGHALPRDAVVRYDEWYGCVKGEPDRGLRLDSPVVAAGILEREARRGEGSLIFDRIADTSIFDEDDGPSIGERMSVAGVVWRKSDKRRVPGWENMRTMMSGRQDVDGTMVSVPMFYVTENCGNFIETVPALERDESHWEDVDTTGIDHIADETRYVLMSRPSVGVTKEEYLERTRSQYDRQACQSDWDEILERHEDTVDDEHLPA